MRVLGRRQGWIHTHFLTDGSAIGLKERQRLRWEMEGFLRGLGIVFGIHFREGERLTVVLECIPDKDKLDKIEKKLGELLKEIGPRPKVTKIRVEGEDGGRREASDEGDPRG